MDAVRRHIILGNVGGNFKLIFGDSRVQMLNTGQGVNLRLDGGSHKRSEPPGHHLRPERRVDYVERLQVFLVLVRQYAVNVLQPLQRRIIVGAGEGVEIGDHVVTFHNGIQQVY